MKINLHPFLVAWLEILWLGLFIIIGYGVLLGLLGLCIQLGGVNGAVIFALFLISFVMAFARYNRS